MIEQADGYQTSRGRRDFRTAWISEQMRQDLECKICWSIVFWSHCLKLGMPAFAYASAGRKRKLSSCDRPVTSGQSVAAEPAQARHIIALASTALKEQLQQHMPLPAREVSVTELESTLNATGFKLMQIQPSHLYF